MSRGFSLVELVMVIVVVAIGVVAIGAAFAHMSRSLALNEDLQRTWQVAHECAEHVLATARPPRGHYAVLAVASPSTACDGLAAAGFTRTVNVTAMATGGTSLCAAGWSCKRVQVTVTRGTATANLNFMVVQY